MKKLSIPTSIFLLLITSYYGIAQPTPTWVKRYDAAGGNDEVRAMIEANGFVYVTGPSDASKSGNIDFATIKYDANGNQIWVARYNGQANGDDYPLAIAVDAAGNVYVTGRSMGSGTNFDYATVKYDANGNQKWVAKYNSPGNRNDVPYAIAVDASGDVFVTGATDCSTNTYNGNSATTIKYDASGVEKMRDTYDSLPNIYTSTLNREQGNSMTLDGNGNIYIAGNGGSNGGLIIKYDNNLQRQWVKALTGDAHKVLADASNNIVVTGWNGQTFKYSSSGSLIWQATNSGAAFWDMALDATGNVCVTGDKNGANGYSDYVTDKYDFNDGHQLWSETFNGSANNTDFARSIALDGSGNVYVTGHCTVRSGKNGLTCAGTIKYNSSGAQQWAVMYDSTNKLTSDGFIVATDVNGNVYVGGQSVNSSTATNYDFVTIKYSNGSAGFRTIPSTGVTENNNIALITLKNYPNPFFNNTIIEYQIPHDGKVTLAIYDLSGREITILVNETKPAGIYKINFESGKLSSGTYLCRIQYGDFNKIKELVVLK